MEKTLETMNNCEGVVGCLLADHAGLCLGVRGDASSESAGIIAAIADQAAKLEPSSKAPIISLKNDNRQCLIHRQGRVVNAVYKDLTV